MGLDKTVLLDGEITQALDDGDALTIVEATHYSARRYSHLSPESLLHFNKTSHSYELGEKFAEGSQGEILTGTDKVLKRYVAIKSLKKDFLGESDAFNSFVAEALTTAKLDHPSIIPIYGISSDEDSSLHMSLKLIHGHTLQEVFEQARAVCTDVALEAKALNQRLESFLSICNAVAFAHKNKVLHRDLKPQNIMLGDNHEVYVMDWGIAQDYSEQSCQEQQVVVGTPGYIAPEVIQREQLGPASDQYALGIILYELVSLRSVLSAKGVKQRITETLQGHRAKLQHYNPKIKIHPDLAAICHKAAALKAEDRYRSVDELANDLRRFMLKNEVLARPDNLIRKGFRLLSRHRSLASILILSLMLISSGLSIYSLNQQSIAAEQSRVRELKLLELRRSVEDRSQAIELHFQKLSMLLDRFADKTAFLLDLGHVDEGSDQSQALKDYRDFKSPASQPEGMQLSKLYQGLISLDYGSYKLAAGQSLASVSEQLQVLAPILPDAMYYVREIGPDSHGVLSNDSSLGTLDSPETDKHGIDENLSVSLVYIGLSNGLFVQYPGNGILSDDYDPRQRIWYQSAAENSAVNWSRPYQDVLSKRKIISASTAISNKRAEFLGVASFDMPLEDSQNSMLDPQQMPALVASYLIDNEGYVILSSLPGVSGDKIPIPGLMEYIARGDSAGYEVRQDGRNTIIDHAAIPTLGWHYIEQVDVKHYLQHSSSGD